MGLKFIISAISIIAHLQISIRAQKIRILEKTIPTQIRTINHLTFKDGVLWLATGSGLFSLENEIFKNYRMNHQNCSVKINTIEIDSSGNKWLGSYSGNLIKFKNNKFTTVLDIKKYLNDDNTMITSIAVNNHANISNNKILLSTANGNILYYDRVKHSSGLMKSPVEKTMIYSIDYGNNDNIWLCTADGFYTKRNKEKWKRKQNLYLAYGVFSQGEKYWAIGRNLDKAAVLMLYYKHQTISGSKYIWKEFKLDKLSDKYVRFYELAVKGNCAWISSDIGLIRYNIFNADVKIFKKYKNIDLLKIRHIVLADNNILWVSTAGNKLYKVEINR